MRKNRSKCICGQTSRWRSWGWFWSKLRRLEIGLSLSEFTAQWQGEGHPCTQSHPAFAKLSSGALNLPAVGCHWHFTPSSDTKGRSWGWLCLDWGWVELLDAPAPAPQQENKDVQEKKGKIRFLLHSVIQHQTQSWGFRESLPLL